MRRIHKRQHTLPHIHGRRHGNAAIFFFIHSTIKMINHPLPLHDKRLVRELRIIRL
ncbi:MAG: DUF4160 domain-containing protein [Sphingobacteriales bacterium]|nr:DUF4160 domain-containing protein [Sphingobacteriales bacterium]